MAFLAMTACEPAQFPNTGRKPLDTIAASTTQRPTVGDLFGVTITRRTIETYETERQSSSYGRVRTIEHTLLEKGDAASYKSFASCTYAPIPTENNDSIWTPVDSTRTHTLLDSLGTHEHSLADTTLLATSCADLMGRSEQPWHYTRWIARTRSLQERQTSVGIPDTTRSTTTRQK